MVVGYEEDVQSGQITSRDSLQNNFSETPAKRNPNDVVPYQPTVQTTNLKLLQAQRGR